MDFVEGKITFQEAIDYGMTKLTAKQEGKTLGSGSVNTDSPVLPVDKLEKDTSKTVNCGNCFEKHKAKSCPAWGYQCSKCHKPNHLAGTKNCKQPPTGAELPYQNNRGGGRGRWNNRGGYNRRGDRRDDRSRNDRRDNRWGDRRDDRN